MRTADFDFPLPERLIAQEPAERRDKSRLLVLHRSDGRREHRGFPDFLQYLRPGDAVVLNDSRVIPARLRGANLQTGGKFELLLVEETNPQDWWAMMRPGKRARVGSHIAILNARGEPAGIVATVQETNEEGHRRVTFSGTTDLLAALEELGEVPLPPYISRAGTGPTAGDRERYQTVYARPPGSVAAPTAGLHFTPELLDRVTTVGARVGFVTLHVGLGTFAPVKSEAIAEHKLHEERYQVSTETAGLIRETKERRGRVFAVGTTTVRVLESIAARQGAVTAGSGRTDIFIYPPHTFRVVDALLTNFHLPRSSLLMLVSAFASPGNTTGRQLVLDAYAEAVRNEYRFFSYGDAMLIL